MYSLPASAHYMYMYYMYYYGIGGAVTTLYTDSPTAAAAIPNSR